MKLQDALAESVLVGRSLIGRFYKGFDDTNHTKQAINLPNHFAWTLGHLSWVIQRNANHFDGQGLLDSDFGTDDPPRKYNPDAVAPGSVPVADASKYPACARCVEIFDRSIDRLAAVAKAAGDDTLQKRVPWVGGEMPLYLVPLRLNFHNGLHAGQLADLRRALQMGYVIIPPKA